MDLNRIASSSNAFGFALLKELWKRNDKKDNVFISPSSISLALSMTLNGALGQTLKDMAAVLGLDENKLAEVNAATKELIAALQSADPEVKLEIANALFTKAGYQFKPEFLAVNQQHFGAEVTPLDFEGDPTGSVKHINDWCSEKTKEKIPSIIDQIPAYAAMFLVNAIYFKGPWSEPFDEMFTSERDFTLLSGTAAKKSTMFQSSEYRYHETDDFQAASLPYGNGSIVMDVILPKPGKTVDEVIASLSETNWNAWLAAYDRRDGRIHLPKFKIEYAQTLNEVLIALGMGSAFDESRSNFSGIVPPPDQLAIKEVRHKTFVEVNEEGTEAAAVTSVGMVFCTSIRVGPPPFVLDVNRPFLCTIRDTKSGAVLFIGAITEPK